MNRPLVIAIASVAVLGGAAAFLLVRPSPAPAPVEPVAAPSTPAPKPAAEAPRRAPVKPAAEPARRAAAPKTEAAPAAPAPVEAAADTGTLRIDSDVPGAQVFIDRQFVGATPVTATDIPAGAHRLNVSAPGYEGIAETIDVEPGPRDIVVRFKEVRLDASLEVVHKHRMGSCKGRLVATPQGLRYETSDKGDAFSAGLQELETFEVDYLKKNLRLKARNGKSYDFTDPEGNADHLFVFHRDVENARERLRKGDAPAR